MSMPSLNTGKTVLITGAGGYIGSALTKAIAASRPGLLILLDLSEHNLYQIEMELSADSGSPTHIPVLGDVCDLPLLASLFGTYHPDIVYHAAALKHVPLMEKNPIAAVKNNAIATFNLAQTAIRHKVSALIMVSTDKAVNPQSIMGASKRVAELSLLRFNNPASQMKAVRLANVWGSSGSVVPLFQQQILRGGPVTVTHPNASRFFLSLNDAVHLVLSAADQNASGIFVPEAGQPVKIVDLAHQLMGTSDSSSKKNIPITFTGLRPGEKLQEELSSSSEITEPTADPSLRRIIPEQIRPEILDARIVQLTDAVNQNDPGAVLETLCSIVPEYRPSEWLLQSLHRLHA